MTTTPYFIAGIDPGAKNTGIVVIDNTKSVVYATTLERITNPAETDAEYARRITSTVLNEFHDFEQKTPKFFKAIEGVEPPNVYHKGKKTILNPTNIIKVAVTAGAFYVIYPEATVIRPRGNGSRPAHYYPDTLRGRRDSQFPGSALAAPGTRRHEHSAYDIALAAYDTLTISGELS